MITVSVIIVNYKTYDLTNAAIKAVHRVLRNYNYEIIVIDNCSKDYSYEKLLKLSDANTHIFETPKNGGFGYGNNYGVAQSQGEYLFFLNSDTILYENVLPEMLACIEQQKGIGVMSCLMEDGNGNPLIISHKFESLRTLLLQTLVKPLVPQKMQNVRAKINHQSFSGEISECDWVSGAAMLIPRTVFLKVGGWNEQFFMYMEDEELCYKIHESGYKITVYPKLGLKHLVGKSGGSVFVAYEKHKSAKLYFRKVKGYSNPLINLLIYIQAWRYLKRNNYKTKLDVIKKLIAV